MKTGTHHIKRRLWLAGIGVACGAALYAAATGCQNDNATASANANGNGNGGRAVIHGDVFPADGEERAVDRFVRVQSASAARADATLTDHHFDRGGELNSLGRSKLDLMLKDDESSLPVVVYVDVHRPDGGQGGAGAGAERCRDAARRYLADKGLADDRVDFRTGPNVNYRHPARDGLRGLRKFESDEATPSENGNDKPAEMPDVSSMLKASNK